MKTLCATLCLISSLSSAALAKESIVLTAEPDQSLLLTGGSREVIVKIDIAAAASPRRQRTPLNIAVVLDRSGSMSGAKIEKARQAATLIVEQLNRDDVFSLVAYDSQVEIIVPAGAVVDRDAIKRRIAQIQPRGGTALYTGVERGALELKEHLSSKRINRVLLLSDGLANIGPSKPSQLRELGSRLAREGISVSTIGLGDDYNEDLMAGLAEASDANYYYVKDTERLPEIFAKELGSLLIVAARELRIQVTCPEHVMPVGFIGRSEKFEGRRAVVRLSDLSAGQSRSLLLRCAISPPARSDHLDVASIGVSYLDDSAGQPEEHLSRTVRVGVTEDEKVARASVNTAVVAQHEWMLNALKKEEALVSADAGRYDHAARQLVEQAARLELQCGNAPAGLRVEFENEARNLRQRAQEFQQNQYSSGARKALQNEAWSVRNSK